MKYTVKFTSSYKKGYKKVKKQGKDLNKLNIIIQKLAFGEPLESKYKNHKLENTKTFNDCNELHIEPHWLLIYKIYENNLVLVLLETGSHSDLFKK